MVKYENWQMLDNTIVSQSESKSNGWFGRPFAILWFATVVLLYYGSSPGPVWCTRTRPTSTIHSFLSTDI